MKFIVFFFFPILIFSQENSYIELFQDKEVLSARMAVKFAIDNNKSLKQYLEKIAQKKAEKYSGYGVSSPFITYTQEGIPNGKPIEFTEKRWSISQEINIPLYSIYRIKAIDEEINSMEMEFEWKKKEIISSTKQMYSKVIYWLEIIRLRDNIKAITKNINDIVSTKLELGRANQLDILNTEIQKMEAVNDLNDAVRNFMLARYDLFYLMGLDPDEQKYTISFTDSLKYLEFNISQDEILDNISETYEYKSIEKLLTSSKTAVKQAWSSLLPSINLNLYKQNYANGFNYNGFEIGLSLPLWIGLDKQTAIQQNEAKYRETTFFLQDTELRIKRNIEHAWHSFEISKGIIESYQNKISETSRQLLDLTLESYMLGQTDLLNLLNVQRTYVDSKIRYFDAMINYYQQIIELEKYLENEIMFTN